MPTKSHQVSIAATEIALRRGEATARVYWTGAPTDEVSVSLDDATAEIVEAARLLVEKAALDQLAVVRSAEETADLPTSFEDAKGKARATLAQKKAEKEAAEHGNGQGPGK